MYDPNKKPAGTVDPTAPLPSTDVSGIPDKPGPMAPAGSVNPVSAAPGLSDNRFEDGGGVPDALDQTSETGMAPDPVSDRINRALALVDQALQYGYQKFGLTSQKQQDAPNDGDEDDTGIPEQSFEEGGSVEEDPADSSLAPEQEPLPLNSDQSAVAQQSEPAIPTEQATIPAGGQGANPAADSADTTPTDPAKNIIPGIKALVSGAGAIASDIYDRAKRAIMHEHPSNPAAQNLAAAEVVANGDPAKMFGVIQLNRKAFGAAQAFAANALDKGNLASAADAATKAYNHVPDGMDVKFTPIDAANGGVAGVTVTVKPLNGTAEKMQMDIPQFRQWLMGRDGKFDNIMNNGPGAIKKAAATPAQGQAPTQSATPQLRGYSGQPQGPGRSQQQGLPPTGDIRPAGAADVNDPTSGFWKVGGNSMRKLLPREKEALLAIPTARREAYMAQFPNDFSAVMGHANADRTKEDLEDVKFRGKQTLEAAREAGKTDRTHYAVDARVSIADKNREALNTRAGASTVGHMINSLVTNNPKIKPEDIAARIAPLIRNTGADPMDVVRQAMGAVAPQGQQPPQQGSSPSSGGRGQPSSARKFYNGQWYVRGPNGEAIPEQR